MSEFSITFYFDLQRFATFNGGDDIGDETGVTFDKVFDSNGKASVSPGKNATISNDQFFFWKDNSSMVSLTSATDNIVLGSSISLVSGKYDSISGLSSGGMSGRTGYVISDLTAIDVGGVKASNTLNFSKINNTTILNPIGTIAIGNNTLKFSGEGMSSTASDSVYGGWDVGTKISVSKGAITSVTAANGEDITTADGTTVNLSGNKNVVTFSNKSFNTITTFNSDGSVSLSAGNSSLTSLEITATTNTASTKAAATTVFDGQAITSITFGGTASSVSANVELGGTKNVGRDISIQGSAINVSGIDGASSTITYSIGKDMGDSVTHTVLNVTDVDPTRNDKRITVGKTGGAEFLMASDFYADSSDSAPVMTSINIAGVTYLFNDTDNNASLSAADGTPQGNGAVFEITDGKVSGFVFRDKGDAITIPQGTDMKTFNIYKAAAFDAAVDNAEGDVIQLEKITITLDGATDNNAVIINKTTDSSATTQLYEITVYDGVSFEIAND